MTNLITFAEYRQPFFLWLEKGNYKSRSNLSLIKKYSKKYDSLNYFEISYTDNTDHESGMDWNGGHYSYTYTLIGQRKIYNSFGKMSEWKFKLIKSTSCEFVDDEIEKLTKEEAEQWFQDIVVPILQKAEQQKDILMKKALEEVEKRFKPDILPAGTIVELCSRYNVTID